MTDVYVGQMDTGSGKTHMYFPIPIHLPRRALYIWWEGSTDMRPIVLFSESANSWIKETEK